MKMQLTGKTLLLLAALFLSACYGDVASPNDLAISNFTNQLLVGEQVNFTPLGGVPPFIWSLTESSVGFISEIGVFTTTNTGKTKIILNDSALTYESAEIIIGSKHQTNYIFGAADDGYIDYWGGAPEVNTNKTSNKVGFKYNANAILATFQQMFLRYNISGWIPRSGDVKLKITITANSTANFPQPRIDFYIIPDFSALGQNHWDGYKQGELISSLNDPSDNTYTITIPQDKVLQYCAGGYIALTITATNISPIGTQEKVYSIDALENGVSGNVPYLYW